MSGPWNRDVQRGDLPALPIAQFGAVGNGVTDDTAAFSLAEASDADTIDLGGKDYAVTLYWQNISAGIFLKKDYINGRILVAGREVVMNAAEGARRSAASRPMLAMPSTAKNIGLYRQDQNNYQVWRPLGGKFWSQMYFGRSTTGIPFNWEQTWLKQVLGYITSNESAVTYSDAGVWGAVTSASVGTYINGITRQANAAAAWVEIAYTGSGDLFVVFVGRTSGNFVNVTLNGGQDYLTLPDDGAGNRYFDSYTPVDNQYKQVVQIASGLPANGTYTIRLTISASKNAGSAGNRFSFNALAFDSESVGPWLPQTDSRRWAAGQAVLENQETRHLGRYYRATGVGTTGSTAPTHTSGSVSDGAVTWAYRAVSSYSLDDHRIQGPGSQLGYAYNFRPTGATVNEDVGGAAHGNEALNGFSWRLNNAIATPGDQSWVVGDLISLHQDITATHSQVGAGATPIVTTEHSWTIAREYVTSRTRHEFLVAAAVGWHYVAMWPLIHYNSASGAYRIGITDIWSPCSGNHKPEDFYWTAIDPPYEDDSVSITKDLLMIATGYALQPFGTSGSPGEGPTDIKFQAWIAIDPESVHHYRRGSRTFASKAINTSNRNPVTTPESTMLSKIYFQASDGNSQASIAAGEVLESSAQYGLALVPA